MIKVLYCNLRGIANVSTMTRLKKIIRLHKVDLVMIMEPMVGIEQLDRYKIRLGFSNACRNLTSKFWFFWRKMINC